MLATAVFLIIQNFVAATPASVTVTPGPSNMPRPILATLGDSITFGVGASDPKKTSYAAILAADLGASWTNLGISGETLIPEPNSFLLGHSASGAPYAKMGGVLADEVSRVPVDSNIVTIYIGTNDIWMSEVALHSNLSDIATMPALFAKVSTAFAADMKALVAGVRARAPGARIVIATNINWADKGGLESLNFSPYSIYRQGLTRLINRMNAAVEAQGATVVDLHCDSRLYDVNNYLTPVDLHPNDKGHAIIAADFLAAIQHPLPPTPCKYDSVLR